MTALVVCPQSRIAQTLRRSGAGWAVSLLSTRDTPPALAAIPAERRLHLTLSDIVAATPGHRLAGQADLERLFAFLAQWDRRTPLLVHCYAGVSRSPATAFAALCALAPETPESMHVQRLRAASPSATPNRHVVALADAVLGRGGRMSAAVAAIGRGRDCFEGDCFTLPVSLRVDGPAGLPA